MNTVRSTSSVRPQQSQQSIHPLLSSITASDRLYKAEHVIDSLGCTSQITEARIPKGMVANMASSMLARQGGKMALRSIVKTAGSASKTSRIGSGIIGGALGSSVLARHKARKSGEVVPPYLSRQTIKQVTKAIPRTMKSLGKTAVVKGALIGATGGIGGVGVLAGATGIGSLLAGRVMLDKGLKKTVTTVKAKIGRRKAMVAGRNSIVPARPMVNSSAGAVSTPSPIKSGSPTAIHSDGTAKLRSGESKRCPAGSSRNDNNQCVMR